MTQPAHSHESVSEQAEEWRAAVGYEGRYEVSDLGRVRSVERIIVLPTGKKDHKLLMQRTVPSVVLRQQRNRRGYAVVKIGKTQHGRMKNRFVHSLLAEAFIGPCPDGMQVRHWDGDNQHNCWPNIVYGTCKENAADRARHGTLMKGENHARAKLNNKTVSLILGLPKRIQAKAIVPRCGVTAETIYKIRRREVWPHITPSSAAEAMDWLEGSSTP